MRSASLRVVLWCLVGCLAFSWVDCQGPGKEPVSEPGVDGGVEKVAPREGQPGEATDRGCAKIDLLNHDLWKQIERAVDPYRSMAPPGKCEDVAFKLEDGVIEVETGICSFLTVAQPLKMDLKKGDRLTVIFWHLNLTAASSAFGYVSLAFGDDIAYVKKIPIPAGPEVYEETFEVKKDVAKGTPLHFHIHNHGANTWKLLSLERLCPEK